VRAAALKAAGALGCPPPLSTLAVAALAGPAWEVRAGAVQALAGVGPSVAVAPVVAAAGDADADVRKAAVIALSPWAGEPGVARAGVAAGRPRRRRPRLRPAGTGRRPRPTPADPAARGPAHP
jgi:HEAT repeat protein